MKLDIIFHYNVNESTGEVTYIGKEEITIDTAKTKKETKKSIKEDGDTEPKLYLEDTKYRLNSKAIELIGVSPGDKLEITYGRNCPQIGISEYGNKVTKAYTVQFRGTKHDELARYGSEFVITNIGNVFQLNSGKEVPELKGDDNVSIDDNEINLDEFIDEEDNVTEITSDFFKL